MLDVLADEPLLWVVRAMDGDRLAGFTVVCRTCKPRPYVYELHVAEGSRGCGLGRALLAEALDVRAIELQVHETNAEAMGFYEHIGFTRHQRIAPTPPEKEGVWVMRRKRNAGL